MNSESPYGPSVVAGNGERAARSSNARLLTVMLAGCLIVTNGCDRKPERPAPPTYPVTGKIAVLSGQLPVGGCVEFKREDEPELTATGVIGADGKFSLSIPFADRVIPGATEGVHRAYVVMPLGANRKSGGYIPIEGDYKVQPAENYFTVTLPSEP